MTPPPILVSRYNLISLVSTGSVLFNTHDWMYFCVPLCYAVIYIKFMHIVFEQIFLLNCKVIQFFTLVCKAAVTS
jgi:hypothetical protein